MSCNVILLDTKEMGSWLSGVKTINRTDVGSHRVWDDVRFLCVCHVIYKLPCKFIINMVSFRFISKYYYLSFYASMCDNIIIKTMRLFMQKVIPETAGLFSIFHR